MSDYFMPTPCKHCPFRRDVTPFLHPERATELALLTENPYNSFSCHKTTEYDEDSEDMEVTSDSKECAGFLTMMANYCGDDSVPKGFTPSYDLCYDDYFDMTGAYEEEWEYTHKK